MNIRNAQPDGYVKKHCLKQRSICHTIYLTKGGILNVKR